MEKEPPAKIYRAGHTLQYTLRGLLILSFWLFWGDFALTFFESIFSRFIPLYLKDLHASNSLIGIMAGSIPGVVNIFFLPNISLWSDHYRGRWGRRIPFLYVMTPLTVVSLLGIGFAPEIAGWVQPLLAHGAHSVGAAGLILPLLCVFAVFYHLFNMVLVNAYNWLLRDVVPVNIMARFLSWFRIISTVASWIFLWYVFPYMISRRREVFLGVGVFYLVSFLLMCWNVKEGEYPPPPLAVDRPGLVKSFGLYFRECLSIPIYRNLFLVFVFVTLGSFCANPFTMLFNRETLSMNMDDMGKIFAWTAAVSALVLFPVGWLCDKFSAVQVTLVSIVCMILGQVGAYLWVTDKNSFFIYSMVSATYSTGWGLGSLAMTMKLFPEEKFGQFSSGLGVFSCGAIILGNYLLGQFMDMVHSDYRMIYVWTAASMAMAIVPMLLVYRGWKQHGGPDHYVAPLPSSRPVKA
jgi:maltose/moltooligosaccharide transporter